MSSNRIPVSVRISQEDFDFISHLQIDGANTPSEKIREILYQARIDHQKDKNYPTVLTQTEEMLFAAKHQLLTLEKTLGIHSHILARTFELVPDLMATLASEYPQSADKAVLVDYEKQVMWRIVRLMDSVLQLAVTAKGAGYDDKVLHELQNTLNLANIIYNTHQNDIHKNKEEK